MSHVRRLLLTDRIFFVSVNVRPVHKGFRDSEYPLILEVLKDSRRRLGFLLCGYVLMPDHWHALIWPVYPLLISQVLHDIKKISTLRIHAAGQPRTVLAAPVLGSIRASGEGVSRAAGLHACEPGSERAGEAARGLAVVKLQ